MKLHAINHDLRSTLWCGPAALSAVTGKPTSHIHEAIRQARNPACYHSPVKGITNTTLVQAARLLGCEMIEVFNWFDSLKRLPLGSFYTQARPTLAKWLRENRRIVSENIVIVNVTGHYVVVSGRSLIDNQVKTVVPLGKAPHRRCRVRRAWIVRAGVLADTVQPPRAKEVTPRLTAGILKIAEHHKIPVEPHLPGEWWVYPPPGLGSESLDPFYDEHLAYDAREAVERINTYVRLLMEHGLGEIPKLLPVGSGLDV